MLALAASLVSHNCTVLRLASTFVGEHMNGDRRIVSDGVALAGRAWQPAAETIAS
jgi:hypothetical protein